LQTAPQETKTPRATCKS